MAVQVVAAHPAGLPPAVLDALPVAGSRALVMGVLNVTPDSFSDGGRWFDPDEAVRHGAGLHADGADIVDVGGESTRPGAGRVAEAEEHRRVVPVVAELSRRGVPVSVDTTRASVAREAVVAGAVLVNDVSGGLGDPAMLVTVAGLGVPYVVTHWRAPSRVMAARARYTDTVAEVRAELADRVVAAQAAGVARERLVVDPGIGFAKNAEHNWTLLADPVDAVPAGLPVLVGVSRKRFLGELLGDGSGPRPPMERDDASTALAALLADRGVWAVRGHNARATRDAVEVAAVLSRRGGSR